VRTIDYVIETKDGFFRLSLPDSYRLTLGPLVVGGKYAPDMHTLVLHIYEGTKQRAIFHNVRCFRDAAIEIEVGEIKVDGSIVWTKLPTLVRQDLDDNGMLKIV